MREGDSKLEIYVEGISLCYMWSYFFHVESIVVNVFFLGCFQLWDRVKKKMFLRFLGELDVS